MEVAQDGGQSAHVVGVGVGEGYGVEVTDAARPESFRDNFFADVEVLRGLMWAATETAAIDEEGFAVGSNQEKRVALANVDGFHEQGVVGMLDGARTYGGDGGKEHRGPGGATLPGRPARQQHGRDEQCVEGGGLDEERRGDTEISQGE